MYINGEWLHSSDQFAVFNPANCEQNGEVAGGGSPKLLACTLPRFAIETTFVDTRDPEAFRLRG